MSILAAYPTMLEDLIGQLAELARAVPDPRDRLLRRIQIEAEAFANSHDLSNSRLLGYVQGMLEAGVLAGYWRKRDANAAAELIRHRYRIKKIRDILLRGDSVEMRNRGSRRIRDR